MFEKQIQSLNAYRRQDRLFKDHLEPTVFLLVITNDILRQMSHKIFKKFICIKVNCPVKKTVSGLRCVSIVILA